jgi:hypothetical protein
VICVGFFFISCPSGSQPNLFLLNKMLATLLRALHEGRVHVAINRSTSNCTDYIFAYRGRVRATELIAWQIDSVPNEINVCLMNCQDESLEYYIEDTWFAWGVFNSCLSSRLPVCLSDFQLCRGHRSTSFTRSYVSAVTPADTSGRQASWRAKQT